MQSRLKFIICAGGTGGHILPGLSLFHELRQENHTVRFVCRKKDLDLIQELKKIPDSLVLLAGTGMRKGLDLKNLIFLYSILINLVRAFLFFLRYHPDAVICMGGYLTFPILLISLLLKKPFFLCEQNSYPGRVNRMFGPYARKVFVNFVYTRRYFKNSRLTGNPVRECIRQKVARSMAIRFFRFQEDRPVLLIMGGSQGSLRINYAVASIFSYMNRFNIIWIVGRENFLVFRKYGHGNVRVLAYLEEMNYAYSIADMAVSRAGAMSITELAYYRIPTLFIPLARSADNHQVINASLLVKAHAAELLEEKELKSDVLLSKIRRLYEERKGYKDDMKRFFIPDSEKLIVKDVLRSLGSRA